MTTILKRVVIRLIILAAVGGLLYGITVVDFSGEQKRFRVDAAAVRVEVQPDASLRVTERLTYDFTGDFSGAHRDVLLAAGVRARNVSVTETGEVYDPGGDTELGSYDRPGTYGAEQLQLEDEDGGPTAGFRVVWHYTAQDEERTFEVSYDVEGAARAYDDVVEVQWAVWGHQWRFWLDDLHAEIALADSLDDPLDAWLQPRKLSATPELRPGSASVAVERLRDDQEAVLRAVFPRSAFTSVSGAQTEAGDGLEPVRAEEDERDDDQGLGSKLAGFVGANIVLIEILWSALVVGAAFALYVIGRDRRSDVPRHLAEPPEDVPPALAYALAEEGGFDDRLVLATLLDLVDRGYYEGTASEDKELDLRLSIPGDRPAIEVLTKYELEAIDFFDRLLEEGPGNLGELKHRIPQHSDSWRNRWEKLRAALDRAEEGELEWERDLTGARAALALVAFAGYVVIALAYWNRAHLVAIPIFATLAGLLFIYLLPATWLKRMDSPSRERHAQWNAFARWTRDFPRLSDDPPATLKLWRRILVYAVAFGTAERVIGSGRIPEPVVADAVGANVWVGPHLSGMDSGFSPNIEGFASGFTSQVAPASSSSDGGGGFSGGGGGASGGGGGGAW